MAISNEDAMRILKESPAATKHWARAVLPAWTGRPFAEDSLPTQGMFSVARAGRTVNYFVNAADVAAAAKRWAADNLEHPDPKARDDARSINDDQCPPCFYSITIDEIIQTATLGAVRFHQ